MNADFADCIANVKLLLRRTGVYSIPPDSRRRQNGKKSNQKKDKSESARIATMEFRTPMDCIVHCPGIQPIRSAKTGRRYKSYEECEIYVGTVVLWSR